MQSPIHPGRHIRFEAGARRTALLAGISLALIGAPAALAASESLPIRGAIHNPARGAYTRTTGIFANRTGWTLRARNLGSGGAAIAECSSAAGGSTSCLDADNLAGGLAFNFQSTGNTGGEIILSNPKGAPFTTNATGVATGLNANYLQGHQASEFQLANQPAANATDLGGQPASTYATNAQLLFADVAGGATASLKANRGATAVTRSEPKAGTATSFTVTFGSLNLSACSFTASPQGASLAEQLGVELSSTSNSQVIVNAPKEYSGGIDLQVIC